jgi:FtsH-binding integral membrane protein
MAHPIATRTIADAPAAERVEFLRGVLTLTSVGLLLTAVSGFIAANVMGPYFFETAVYGGQSTMVFHHQWIYLLVVLGAMIGAQALGPKLAVGNIPELGLIVGSTLMGVCLGPILYLGYMVAGPAGGGGMTLIGEALGLTSLTAIGMTGYVWTKPRDFSLLGAAMSAIALPMFALMMLSFFIPFGNTFGLILVGGFVLFSAATLLFNLNSIIHTMGTDRKHLAAVTLTLAIGVLFYNILMLLIRLQGRD